MFLLLFVSLALIIIELSAAPKLPGATSAAPATLLPCYHGHGQTAPKMQKGEPRPGWTQQRPRKTRHQDTSHKPRHQLPAAKKESYPQPSRAEVIHTQAPGTTHSAHPATDPKNPKTTDQWPLRTQKTARSRLHFSIFRLDFPIFLDSSPSPSRFFSI